MALRRVGFSTLLLLVFLLSATRVDAQTTTTTTTSSQVAGVAVDPDGVLRMHIFADRGGALARARISEAKRTLPAEIVRTSELRKISLNRLEAARKNCCERVRSRRTRCRIWPACRR